MLKEHSAAKPIHLERPKKERFAGVIPPLITPCKASGEIDYAAIKRCVGELTSRGCDGLFVISSTGGMPFLDEEDRRRIVAAARESCPTDKTLYAGISAMGIRQALRYAREMQAEGADAAVVMAPFFLRLSQDELLSYFTQIADDCPIPLCMYHHVAMRTPIEVETVAKLAEHPNVVAFKDTSERMDRMEHLIRATRHTRMTLLQGSEPIILRSLKAGGHGCVSALANVAPEWHRELLEAFRNHDDEQAELAQQRISALWKMFEFPQMRQSFSYFARSLAVAVKYRGWCESAATVVPGSEPDPAFNAAVEQHLRTVGLAK